MYVYMCNYDVRDYDVRDYDMRDYDMRDYDMRDYVCVYEYIDIDVF